MLFFQKVLELPAYARGYHLITSKVTGAIPELSQIRQGMLQVFIQHTSASLTINENADPTVRKDFESHLNKLVPENHPYYLHTSEGADDMPAHLKASLMGASVLLPIRNGQLMVGTWQGIYLCEHRNHGGSRTLILSAWGC